MAKDMDGKGIGTRLDILVAEPNQPMRAAYQKLFEAAPLVGKLTVSSNLEEKGRYDLCFIDHIFGNYEWFVDELKQANPRLYVVVTTTFPGNVPQNGFNAVLHKPFTPDEAYLHVHKALARKGNL